MPVRHEGLDYFPTGTSLAALAFLAEPSHQDWKHSDANPEQPQPSARVSGTACNGHWADTDDGQALAFFDHLLVARSVQD